MLFGFFIFASPSWAAAGYVFLREENRWSWSRKSVLSVCGDMPPHTPLECGQAQQGQVSEQIQRPAPGRKLGGAVT